MSPESHILQWRRRRADTLIAESTVVHATLSASLPQFRIASDNYLNALNHYTAASARTDERNALLELGRRAGRRSVQMVTRQQISQDQAETEQDLFLIHYGIYMTQFLIAMGKIAEMGLSFAGTIKSLKVAVDQMKLIADGVKAAQPVAAEFIAAGTGGQSNATPENIAVGSAQIIAVLLRMDSDLVQWGKSLTDIVGTYRRARNMRDASTCIEALAQLMKTVFDQLKVLIDLIEGSNKSGMAGWAGGAAVAMSIVRDAVSALRAFMAMYDEVQEMKKTMERMDRWIAEGNRYLGSEQQAIERLSRFTVVSEDTIDEIMGSVHDLQTARVLADRSRQQAERIGAEMMAAASFRRSAMTHYKSALANVEPHLRSASEKLGRFTLLIVDMNFVAEGKVISRGSADIAEARTISERLTRHRDLLRGVVQEYRQPAAGN